MVWEFPAVSQTRVEFWNEPQYTQSGMWWFTLFFGFFGLHHLYLRSPQTALMFFIANCISLGYPWIYDLVQLSNAGGETLDSLNKHGLAHPWGALGLAQGMWKESESGNSMFSGKGSNVKNASPAPSAPPNTPAAPPSAPPNNPSNTPAPPAPPNNPSNTPNPNTPAPSDLNKLFPAPTSQAEAEAKKADAGFGLGVENYKTLYSANPPKQAELAKIKEEADKAKKEYELSKKPVEAWKKSLTGIGLNPPTLKQQEDKNFLTQKASLANTRLTEAKKAYEKTASQSGGAAPEGPPNPLWFLLYALSIPAAPLAQMIAGDSNNAVSRFLDLTIVPLGFLFYFWAMMYDYLILFMFPADLLVAGSKRFFPFTYLGMDADGHSERLTGKSEIKPCPADGIITTMIRIGLPVLSYFFPGLGKTLEAALETKDKIIDTAVIVKEQVIDKGQDVIEIAGKVGRLSERIQDAQNAEGNGGQAKGKYMDPSSGKPYGTMVGGSKSTFSTLDYAALASLAAVISGGFLLSINRSLNAGNDSPPNPRAI